jgi:hypothetical protein
MTELTVEHIWQLLVETAESGEPDFELYLDAADIIHRQAEQTRRLEQVVETLRAENQFLRQSGSFG